MVKPHVAPQFHQRAVGLFPCPPAGTPGGLRQAVAVLFHTDDDGLAFVYLRPGVHDGENALRAGRRRQQRVHLLADLPYRLADLLDVQQIGAQRADVKHTGHGQQSAHAAGDGVVDLAEIAHGGHHHTGVGLSRRGRLTVLVVESGKPADSLLFMVENLDDLLAFDHLLDITVYRAQRLLLPLEVDTAAAADHLHYSAHQGKEGKGDQRQDGIEDDHHQHRTHKGQHIGDDAGKAAVEHLRHGVDIVGEPAHEIAGLVAVIVADGQLLQMVKQVLPDGRHRPLGHMHHDAGISERAQGAEGEQAAHQQQHPEQSGEIAGQDIVVQQRLEHIAGGHTAGGAGDQAHRHQHQRRFIAAHIMHQLFEGALHILGALKAVGLIAGTVSAPGHSSVVSHRCSPLPAETHRPRDRWRSFPSAVRGCPVPPHGRHPAPGSCPRPSPR